jgi:hypothetical protein
LGFEGFQFFILNFLPFPSLNFLGRDLNFLPTLAQGSGGGSDRVLLSSILESFNPLKLSAETKDS